MDWSLPVLILNLDFNRLVYISGGEQVFECLEIYKNIADTVQMVKKYFDFLYMLALMMATPDMIFTTYIGLLRFKNIWQTAYLGQMIRTVLNFENFVLLSLPAISAGLVNEAVDDLKLILLERLLREKDTDHECHIQIFVDYVTSRPMRFTVFKVVPLDWSLPVLILNLSITYQIIIVQFTKLY
ncbi:hypothetical protein ABMA28_008514 [Loxostege sticticalis]|uniref:Gustatory receptor n=1 Tax=Loxostege sticticalis TaxID=481309 RepID=A0ABD0SHF1_LOXSC